MRIPMDKTPKTELGDGKFIIKLSAAGNVVIEYVKNREQSFSRRVVLEESPSSTSTPTVDNVATSASASVPDVLNVEKWKLRFANYTSIRQVEAEAWLVNGQLSSKQKNLQEQDQKQELESPHSFNVDLSDLSKLTIQPAKVEVDITNANAQLAPISGKVKKIKKSRALIHSV